MCHSRGTYYITRDDRYRGILVLASSAGRSRHSALQINFYVHCTRYPPPCPAVLATPRHLGEHRLYVWTIYYYLLPVLCNAHDKYLVMHIILYNIPGIPLSSLPYLTCSSTRQHLGKCKVRKLKMSLILVRHLRETKTKKIMFLTLELVYNTAVGQNLLASQNYVVPGPNQEFLKPFTTALCAKNK